MHVVNGIEFEYFYFGNLVTHEIQYKNGLFAGLALHPQFPRDIRHDLTKRLPFETDSIKGGQAQDVFEHIEYDAVPSILDEVYRCLAPGGLFRMSVPDYHSPLLQSRSAYDKNGNILCDLAMGGSLKGIMSGGIKVSLEGNGIAHLWFPTYAQVLDCIIKSDIRRCSQISVHHAWLSADKWVANEFDQTIMPVMRCPPTDMRADGKPISIIVDFVK